MSDELPVHLGTVERTGTVQTDDGWALSIETDQGEFLLDADSKQAVDALSMSVDMYLSKMMRGGTDAN